MSFKKNIFLSFLVLITCSEEKKISKKESFSNAVRNFEMCKTDYEILYNRKPTINVKNGTKKAGLAKNISDFLRSKCFDTYFGNWEGKETKINQKKGVEFTYIIVDNLSDSNLDLVNELNDILGLKLSIEIKYPECNYKHLDECLKIKKISQNNFTLVLGGNIIKK